VTKQAVELEQNVCCRYVDSRHPVTWSGAGLGRCPDEDTSFGVVLVLKGGLTGTGPLQIPGLMPFQQRKTQICNFMAARLYVAYESCKTSTPSVGLRVFFR